MRPIVLTIAGFDPSSGAGITADIKTIAAHGCYGVSCITALTVQSTQGVRRTEPVSGKLVGDTLDELASDFSFAAVRIGMLGSGEVAEAVHRFLVRHRPPNVVLDPIIRASSGAALIDPEGERIVRERLLRLATVITPNIDEAAQLTGLEVNNVESMSAVARVLHTLGPENVVITGGHLDPPVDLLSTTAGQEQFRGEHIESRSTHGTGCAFATAIACNLALGNSMHDAVTKAREFVRTAIERAYAVGKGTGPINHLWKWDSNTSNR
jgi:hydroxymethylpyrimidine/phosphomethylpyrimidine kinase